MSVPKPIVRNLFFLSPYFFLLFPISFHFFPVSFFLPAAGAGNFYVRFPDDVPSLECVPGLQYGAPEVYNPDSLDLVITYQDESFLPFTPDGSFQVERTWSIYNAATYDPGLPLINVPNPAPMAGFQAPASMTGPVLSASDAPAPWSPTVSRINPTDSLETNYGVFWSPTANGYQYKQLIWVIDTRDPVILDCQSDTLAVIDSTSNDPQLWNAPFWWDPVAFSNDLTDAPVNFSITTVDSCGDGQLGVEYYLYMDLDGNGAWETVAGNYPSVAPAGTVLYGNLDNPSNGTDVRLFDHRPVPVFQKYRFVTRVTANGLERTFTMAWRSDLPAPASDTFVPVQLPWGRYKVCWIAEDGFWNQDTCEYVFTVGPDSVVNAPTNYYIKFPDDVIANGCNATNLYGEPEFFLPAGLDLDISYHDYSGDPIPGPTYCFSWERVWYITNPATYDENQPLIYIPNPQPSSTVSNPVNWPGPVVAPFGAAPPWTPTEVKIYPADPAPTNYGQFWSAVANGYEYTQHLKILDLQDPEIGNCPATAPVLPDTTGNAALLWNDPAWLDPFTGSHDLGEAPVDLFLSGIDSCGGVNVFINYLLFLDLDQDGLRETVVDSKNLPPANTVMFGNAGNPNYSGGEARAFDQRPVPAEEKYRFSVHVTTSGGLRNAALRWNTADAPAVYAIPQLPPGHHRIRWKAEDGCGQDAVCEYDFTVQGDTTVQAGEASRSAGFRLEQNRPNPWNERTIISFELPAAGPVRLTISDATGRLVYVHDGAYAAGRHSVTVNGAVFGGEAGCYRYTLLSEEQALTRKMLRVE